MENAKLDIFIRIKFRFDSNRIYFRTLAKLPRCLYPVCHIMTHWPIHFCSFLPCRYDWRVGAEAEGTKGDSSRLRQCPLPTLWQIAKIVRLLPWTFPAQSYLESMCTVFPSLFTNSIFSYHTIVIFGYQRFPLRDSLANSYWQGGHLPELRTVLEILASNTIRDLIHNQIKWLVLCFLWEPPFWTGWTSMMSWNVHILTGNEKSNDRQQNCS